MRTLNIEQVQGAIYKPGFARTEITDQLSEIFGYQFAYRVMEEKELNKIVKNAKAKNVAKMKNNKKGAQTL